MKYREAKSTLFMQPCGTQQLFENLPWTAQTGKNGNLFNSIVVNKKKD